MVGGGAGRLFQGGGDDGPKDGRRGRIIVGRGVERMLTLSTRISSQALSVLTTGFQDCVWKGVEGSPIMYSIETLAQ